MTENKVSKVLAYISAALSGIFILLAADVIIFQKKYAELCGVPDSHIEATGTVIPYGAAAYIILALALIIISVRVIMKKYTNADAIVTAVLWGVMWLGAFAAGSIQVHYAWKNGFDGYLVLVTLQQIISMFAALLVLAAVMAAAAADCAAFVYNRRKVGKGLPKAAIAFSAVYIFATLILMLLVREKPTIVIGVVVLWVSAAAAIIAAAVVMSGKGGLVPLVVCLVLFAAALVALPVCNTIQSRIIAVTGGSEALADFGVVSGYCGYLNILLYIGVALAVCSAARSVYQDKDTSERIE
ncbi:MAG: hypothetical protein ACI4JF_07520 [Oscillospiraceae bacterium]